MWELIAAKTESGGVDIGQVWRFAQVPEFKTLSGLFSFILPRVLILGGVMFFIMIIIAGLGVIMGAGSDDPASKEKAKNFLTYSIIGLIIMIGAYWILQIINVVTGGSLDRILQ